LASTVWVYAGAIGPGPFDEETPFHLPGAGHIYTSSKIAAEMVVHNYHELYGQPYTILRYGIPYGPRMRDALVIPQFIRRALEGAPITINGDGSQFRNYVYVATPRCLPDVGGTRHVDGNGLERVFERVVDVRHGGEMEHHIDTVERHGQCVDVGDVERDIGDVAAMGCSYVEHGDPVARGNQGVDDVRSDEARAAGARDVQYLSHRSRTPS
jgi:hypothetical protein